MPGQPADINDDFSVNVGSAAKLSFGADKAARPQHGHATCAANELALELKPFLKWPGGKRWFTARYAHLLPKSFKRYIEPFLGSGAVYFHLKPATAILGDLNAELIAAYTAVKNYPTGLTRSLSEHQRKHGTRHYYATRKSSPKTPATKAARLIYLNRTCFNGIYRVNLAGVFNVPKGTKDAVVLDTDDFAAAARLLATADLRVTDFAALLDEATKDDLVFADPPYTVRHNHNGFVKYNEDLFSWADQERLATSLASAHDRGALVISTNANHRCIRELYPRERFLIRTVSRYSSISADAAGRQQFEEIVIRGRKRETVNRI